MHNSCPADQAGDEELGQSIAPRSFVVRTEIVSANAADGAADQREEGDRADQSHHSGQTLPRRRRSGWLDIRRRATPFPALVDVRARAAPTGETRQRWFQKRNVSSHRYVVWKLVHIFTVRVHLMFATPDEFFQRHVSWL